MNEICKNCQNTITENFCGNCGQKKFKRIDKKYVFDEIQYLALHTNKGFFYSIKKILRNPGKTAKEFIDGNRVNHYKPILHALVLGGLTSFISFKIMHSEKIVNDLFSDEFGVLKTDGRMKDFMDSYMNIFSSYYSLIMLSTVPFFSLAGYWAFKKWRYNYFESIILNTYFYIYYTLIGLIITPLNYLGVKFNFSPMILPSISLLATPFLLYWFYKGTNPEKHSSEIIVNLLKFYLLLALIFIVIYLLLIISVVIYVVLTKL